MLDRDADAAWHALGEVAACGMLHLGRVKESFRGSASTWAPRRRAVMPTSLPEPLDNWTRPPYRLA